MLGIQWPIVLQYLKYLERRGDIRYEEKISQEPQLGLNGTWVVELLREYPPPSLARRLKTMTLIGDLRLYASARPSQRRTR